MSSTPKAEPAPACPVCRDTGIVQCPDPDRESMYETACPERIHDGQPCPQGYAEALGSPESHCGMEPCPFGCPFVPIATTGKAGQ